MEAINKKKILLITGFGAFADILDNPTSIIVKHFQTFLHSITLDTNITIEIVYEILEVSVDYCHSFVERIQLLYPSNEYEVYCIHLGVDSNAQEIKLEQFAYNNMTFRVPDYRGYQPSNQCILDTNDFDSLKACPLNVSQMLTNLNQTIREQSNVLSFEATKNTSDEIDGVTKDIVWVRLSSDPGRYLCNYIYYSTLSCQQLVSCSLFVHVPPFDQINQTNQEQLIQWIIREYLTQLCI